MKTLLWKEYRENRLMLALLILLGGMMIMGLQFTDRDNQEMIVLVVFLICSPMIMAAWGILAFSTEVNQGTFPLLAGLPLSRSRILAAKLVSGILFGTVMYSAFYLFATMAGIPSISYQISEIQVKMVSPFFLLFGLPLSCLAVGLLGGLLAEGPRGAFIGTLVFLLYVLGAIGALPFLNPYLLVPLVAGVLFTSAWITFRHSELLYSSKSVWLAAISLFLTGSLALGVWKFADNLAHRHYSLSKPWYFSLEGSDDQGKTVLLQAVYHSPWWDPIASENLDCVLRIGVEKPGVEINGQRGTRMDMVSPLGRSVSQTHYQWPGFWSSKKLQIKTQQGEEILQGGFSSHMFQGDTFIYRHQSWDLSGNEQNTIRLLRPGSPENKKELVSLPPKLEQAFSVTRHGHLLIPEGKKMRMIGLNDGIQRELEFPEDGPQHWIDLDKGFLVRTRIVDPSETIDEEAKTESTPASFTYYLVDQNLRLKVLSFIPPSFRFHPESEGNKAWGTFIAAAPSDPASVSLYVGRLDFDREELQVIATFPNLGWIHHSIELDVSKKEMVLLSHGGSQVRAWRINLERDDEPVALPHLPSNTGYLVNIGFHKYAMESSQQVYVLDTFQESLRKIYPLDN